ncbi:ABC transporter permease [Anaerotruncus sp. AF02-27]|uniref:ABC transporter permease subunit n=1 Tax=Anaerotruncus TaxID=244127 RepID=UPI000E46E8DD|nr:MULTISPECIES: ABC transporter permease [Anaerotruncus]RGX55512.1 ABC transporter permease [Anaerotruncus sp. AF02-27]
MNRPKSGAVKRFLVANIVPILFSAICLLGVLFSGSNPAVILMDVVARFDRNAFLVLSLIIPILTGLGLNFGIVLGAMAGQAAIFIVCVIGLTGMTAVFIAAVISIPLAVLFGWLSGLLLNRTKGQEMITSMILGFFAAGVYQFIFLFALGGIFPIDAPEIMLGTGVGVRNTIDLGNMKYALDNLWKVDLFTGITLLGALLLAVNAIRLLRPQNRVRRRISITVLWGTVTVFGLVGGRLPQFASYQMLVKIPMAPFLLIAGLCLLIPAFLRTKLGQEMRAVGQDMGVAAVAGIDVNRTRIIAICISTVIAALGQIIFLQNLGNLSTYNAHENVGMFSAAALLIGGAAVSKATVGQALMGTVLFHLLFNVSPMAGKNLFGSAEIGEYFRVFIAYGIIAVTLALYAWKKVVQQREKNKLL